MSESEGNGECLEEIPAKRVCREDNSFVNGDKYEEQLSQFHVLDEVQDGSGSEMDDENGGYDTNEYGSSDSELDELDIENLLDEQLPDDLRNKKKEQAYDERSKIVLDEKGRNHFEMLPEGWLQVTHISGMPIYLHRQSRVCSASKPYFLGPGSVRKHEIPLSAIPCLNYRKALEKEEELRNDLLKVKDDNIINTESEDGNEVEAKCPLKTAHIPNAKIETVKENLKEQSLTSVEFYEYCKKVFKFKTIRVMRFKSWSARRKFTKNKKHIKNLQRPTLPDGTKLITFPVVTANAENSGNARPKKEWIMNPNGKSFVCILHEYVQHVLKKQPTYEFKELENAATPYSATVTINDLKYGTGFGTSKKQAKSEAARETLEILIPDVRDKISSEKNKPKKGPTKELSIFDEIKIEDPRIAEFCAKTTEPSPHQILLTCLQRNFGLGDVKINYEVNTKKHKKNEFTMTVGKHTATVECKNKRDGKQRASQAILQLLHPHIHTWGSLLRLYGNNSVKSYKEKKQEEQEITVLQSKATVNQPNYAILEKLKLEMTKLTDSKEEFKPIGIFIPPNMPQASSSNLNSVEL